MPLFVPLTLEAGERPFVVLIAGLSFYIYLMNIHARLRNCWGTNYKKEQHVGEKDTLKVTAEER